MGGSVAADDGVLRAYGLVYFLLKHGVTVYWAVDGATPKASVTDADLTVPGPIPGCRAEPVVGRWLVLGPQPTRPPA